MLTCHPHPLFTVKFLAEFQTVQVQGTHFEITSQHRLLEMTMRGLYCLNPDFNTLHKQLLVVIHDLCVPCKIIQQCKTLPLSIKLFIRIGESNFL